jgi:hypothetical protein
MSAPEVDLSDVPVTDDIQELEQAWAGGVADLGDPSAALVVQEVDGYEEYKAALVKVLKRKMGKQFTMYRAVSDEQFEEWRDGASMGPLSFTFDRSLAKNWKKIAPLQGKKFIIVSTLIQPEWVIMRGKEEESELVVDGDSISYHTLAVIG